MELYPRIEAKWMKRGYQEKVLTPGYNKRTNIFVTLFWPKKYGYIWNKFEKRRSRELKLHLSNLLQYAKRHGVKTIILFMDHAPCHKTKTVKRLIRRYKIIKAKLLPKKAPELNPTEWVINRPLKSAICANRSYSSIHDVNRHATDFLNKRRMTLRT